MLRQRIGSRAMIASSATLMFLGACLIASISSVGHADANKHCVSAGAPQCYTCGWPYQGVEIFCKTFPPAGYQYGGCVASPGTSCNEVHIYCGGNRWSCDGDHDMGESDYCKNTVVACDDL